MYSCMGTEPIRIHTSAYTQHTLANAGQSKHQCHVLCSHTWCGAHHHISIAHCGECGGHEVQRLVPGHALSEVDGAGRDKEERKHGGGKLQWVQEQTRTSGVARPRAKLVPFCKWTMPLPFIFCPGGKAVLLYTAPSKKIQQTMQSPLPHCEREWGRIEDSLLCTATSNQYHSFARPLPGPYLHEAYVG